MSIPTGYESERGGPPSSCNICHTDRDALWTRKTLEAWAPRRSGARSRRAARAGTAVADVRPVRGARSRPGLPRRRARPPRPSRPGSARSDLTRRRYASHAQRHARSNPNAPLPAPTPDRHEPVALELIGVFLALLGLLLGSAIVTLAPEGSPRALRNVTGALGRSVAEGLTLALGRRGLRPRRVPRRLGHRVPPRPLAARWGRKALMVPLFAGLLAILAALVLRRLAAPGLWRAGPGGYLGAAFAPVLFRFVGRAAEPPRPRASRSPSSCSRPTCASACSSRRPASRRARRPRRARTAAPALAGAGAGGDRSDRRARRDGRGPRAGRSRTRADGASVHGEGPRRSTARTTRARSSTTPRADAALSRHFAEEEDARATRVVAGDRRRRRLEPLDRAGRRRGAPRPPPVTPRPRRSRSPEALRRHVRVPAVLAARAAASRSTPRRSAPRSSATRRSSRRRCARSASRPASSPSGAAPSITFYELELEAGHAHQPRRDARQGPRGRAQVRERARRRADPRQEHDRRRGAQHDARLRAAPRPDRGGPATASPAARCRSSSARTPWASRSSRTSPRCRTC